MRPGARLRRDPAPAPLRVSMTPAACNKSSNLRMTTGLVLTLPARPRQRMRRKHRNADGVTVKLLERESAQDFRRHLNQQHDVQLAVAQPVQHFLGGQAVNLDPHDGLRFLKKIATHAKAIPASATARSRRGLPRAARPPRLSPSAPLRPPVAPLRGLP